MSQSNGQQARPRGPMARRLTTTKVHQEIVGSSPIVVNPSFTARKLGGSAPFACSGPRCGRRQKRVEGQRKELTMGRGGRTLEIQEDGIKVMVEKHHSV
jgi:hypothetical protein